MRLFVAVWPSAEARELLGALPRPAVPGLRWSTPDQWHVTLRFLGEADPDEVRAALAAVEGTGPAEARLGPATARFGNRVLHVPVDGLDRLAASVVAATGHLGRPPEGRPFRGHVTLARPVGRGRPDLRPLVGTPLAASWPVASVALVASRLRPAGAVYETEATVPLA